MVFVSFIYNRIDALILSMEQDSSDNSDNIVYETAPCLYDRLTENPDVMSIARLSRSIPDMRHALSKDPRFPFESPCLLHSYPYKWPQDQDAQVFCVLLFISLHHFKPPLLSS